MTIDHTPTFPVHDVVRVTFKNLPPTNTYNAINMPCTIRSLYDEACLEDHGEGNLERHIDKLAKQKDSTNMFTCDPIIKDDTNNEVPPPSFPNKKDKLCALDRELIDTHVDNQLNSEQDLINKQHATNYTPEQKKATLTKLHLLIDEELHKLDHRWRKLLSWENREVLSPIFQGHRTCCDQVLRSHARDV